MSIDIHLTHVETSIEVVTLGTDLQDTSYVIRFGDWPNRVNLFVSHEQLREITGMAVNEMMATVPTEDFSLEVANVVGLSITQRDEVPSVMLRCEACNCRHDGRLDAHMRRCEYHWTNADVELCPTCGVSHPTALNQTS